MPRKRKAAQAPVEITDEEQQPVAGEFVHEADRQAEITGYTDGTDIATPKEDAPASVFKLPARQAMTTYTAGAILTHDRERGVYRIHFNPKMDQEEFKTFFREQIKPLLTGEHALKGGPATRFIYDSANRDWEIRYRFIARDNEGRELFDDNGKKQYLNLHQQVQVIAQRVTDRAAGLIQEKLGLVPQMVDIPM